MAGRLPEQPIFCPVPNEEYATKIAGDWNVPASGSGYVTQFEVRKSFLDNDAVRAAADRIIGRRGWRVGTATAQAGWGRYEVP
jgi:hypothetical protein